MKSTFEILDVLYLILNESKIPGLISGIIYKGSVDSKSQKEDIEINVLTNPNGYLQAGIANINFYCLDSTINLPNTKRMKEIIMELIKLLDNKSRDNFFFQVENQTGPFKDQDRDKMHYANIRLTYQTI